MVAVEPELTLAGEIASPTLTAAAARGAPIAGTIANIVRATSVFQLLAREVILGTNRAEYPFAPIGRICFPVDERLTNEYAPDSVSKSGRGRGGPQFRFNGIQPWRADRSERQRATLSKVSAQTDNIASRINYRREANQRYLRHASLQVEVGRGGGLGVEVLR
jgi:hypothetical protein